MYDDYNEYNYSEDIEYLYDELDISEFTFDKPINADNFYNITMGE